METEPQSQLPKHGDDVVQILTRIEQDLSSPKGKDASGLALKEIERVFTSVLDDFKSLTSRAGTILSILISVVTAVLAVVTAVVRPPIWVPLIPAVPLVIALFTSCWLFLGSKVTVGLKPQDLADLAKEPEIDATLALIDSYRRMLVGDKTKNTEGRKLEPPQEKHFVGNLRLLQKKQQLYELSVVLLGIAVALVVGVSLALYL